MEGEFCSPLISVGGTILQRAWVRYKSQPNLLGAQAHPIIDASSLRRFPAWVLGGQASSFTHHFITTLRQSSLDRHEPPLLKPLLCPSASDQIHHITSRSMPSHSPSVVPITIARGMSYPYHFRVTSRMQLSPIAAKQTNT
ncbi:hypothetical protein BOTBODRAFT_223022 [Botryobasidium botryosum FD-172 SS1]|uniref:Uncharacterized protein n=1 Tax=Botryobasidium botryosum (strain FD-172 SS1) TaxID=930990 RepID=A0A067MQM6_BOTB1|nr:hypothetical protein BOTBODRAFT_223022 [Botryobasidium botryosum FD-172 SS1]